MCHAMNGWYNGESSIYPALVDETSSKKWVYVRRNVEQHERENMQGETETFYTFEEQKVSKDIWEIFKRTNETAEKVEQTDERVTGIESGITDIELALVELYEGMME